MVMRLSPPQALKPVQPHHPVRHSLKRTTTTLGWALWRRLSEMFFFFFFPYREAHLSALSYGLLLSSLTSFAIYSFSLFFFSHVCLSNFSSFVCHPHSSHLCIFTLCWWSVFFLVDILVRSSSRALHSLSQSSTEPVIIVSSVSSFARLVILALVIPSSCPAAAVLASLLSQSSSSVLPLSQVIIFFWIFFFF